MAAIPPGSNPAIERARAAMLAWLDRQIAKAPPEWQPGLQGLREQVATSSTIPADLMGGVLTALADAFKRGDFGPAKGSDSDHA